MDWNDKNNAIGIFDSGIGGISIASEIHKLLPNEQIKYLADSKNAPYGSKSKQAILSLAQKNTEKLIELGVKIIVVACNTATTNAIQTLRNTYSIPFIGIEPAIKPAAIKTKIKKIGILATKGTLASRLFSETSKKYVSEQIQVIQVEGNAIVEAIESNTHHSDEFIQHLNLQLLPFKTEHIDILVLGCTHYPFIIQQIQSFLPEVKIIDSGFAVAKQTKKILSQKQLLKQTTIDKPIQIYSNATSLEAIQLISQEKFDRQLRIEYLDF